MTDISEDRRFQPVLDALISLHGSYRRTPQERSLERGQVAEFLVMLDAATKAGEEGEHGG